MDDFLLNKTILLIDPDPETESFLCKTMEGTDVHIVRVGSGKEGVNALHEIEPDLIVSEFETEDVDGRALLRTLREDQNFIQFRHTPFILLSEKTLQTQYSKELFDLGLRGWYTKPYSACEFREVLTNLFMAQEIIQKNSELRQEVKRSEYRYRDLLENANDFIFTLDCDGKFVYLNNRFAPLTGWDKESWLGKIFLDLIAPDDRNLAFEHYQMAHQGRARVFEAKILGKLSQSPVLSFNITPILERGKIIGSMGIARDVTEKKKMEKEILDLKNFNESIIQSMEAGLLTTDLDGHITSLNAGAERILGWKSEEVLKKQIRSVLKPEEVNILFSSLPKHGSLPYSRETELTVKSGKKIAIGFTATDRIDNQNKKVGMIVSFRDITQLKQMQSEVIRMDRLASLGVLASGIAHEIKNPLAGIKTMAQACEEEFCEDDPRKEYVTRIVRQVNRLNELLKTFFEYARPKPPDRKKHALSEILHEVTNLVAKKLSNAGITYVEDFTADIPEVMVDSQQIQQVFLNLILNAVDAMPSGGFLKVSTRNIINPDSGIIRHKGEKDAKGSFVEVVVSDTGTGIPMQNLETIFDPFFTTKTNGMGLGLSIVHRIIEEHQGDIRVESRIGHGTSFTITLPTGV